ncbi:MAG: UDP-N-acetylmuramyl peptide synthase [Legionella sp.]|nr:UDP-N-acetylmuramyl peptide synthase [Legionella sp.]
MNKNAQCYYESALKLFMPIELEPDVAGFVVNLGKKRYFFYGFGTPLNNGTSAQISRNKFFTNKVLEKAGLPVPKAAYIHISEFEEGRLEEKIAKLSFPLVAKPLDEGKFGRDVLCNIQNLAQLNQYLSVNLPKSNFVIVEEFHGNLNSYRVLVFNYRIIGVIHRYPAHVDGDDKHTIEELVDLTNKKRLESSDTLGPILIDDECHIRLNELGIDVNYIPGKGERVTLCYTSNASRGGTYASLSKKIHKENRKLLLRAARVLNLKLVGFDVQCQDINVPILSSNGVIIESNDSPSVRIHEQPLNGKSIAVTRVMVRSLIYRHPVAYLVSLYNNHRTAFCTRSALLFACISVIYHFQG